MTDQKLTRLERLKAWSESGPKVREITPPSQRRPKGPSRLERAAERLASQCAGVTLSDGWLSYRGRRQRLTGLTIVVESASDIHRRATVTRTAIGGLAAGGKGAIVGALLTKRVDDRELYFTINGPAYAWSVPVPPALGAEARAFAARVTTAAK